MTDREHLKALESMGYEVEIKSIEMPLELGYLYCIFKDLKFVKSYETDESGNQITQLKERGDISFNDIHCYSELTGLDFYKWEIETIMSLQGIFNGS